MRKKYIDYDHNETFTSDINIANEAQVENLLKHGKVKCVYATKTIKSGSQLEIEIYPEFSRRQIRSDPSIKKKYYEAQKNLNDANSRKQLERLINTNFGENDIWSTLTYDCKHLPKSEKEMLRNMQNYIRRLQRRRKKNDLPPAKYIYITEYNDKDLTGCHHHLVIDGAQSKEMVEEVWNCSNRNHTRRTKTYDKGLIGIAKYLSKDPKGSKRWCSSMNLKQPTIRKNHQDFRMKQIRQMTENRNMIRELIEKKYPNMIYISESAKYNDVNGRTYFAVRLVIPEEREVLRE